VKIFDPFKLLKWLPVDVYIGGMEHALLHLLYARFIQKFLYLHGFIPEHKEPFTQLITQGLVKGKTYRLKSNGGYIDAASAGQLKPDEYTTSFEKMSKSKGNGVNPLDVIEEFGCDALRMGMLFYGPSEKDIHWEETMVKNMV
jgi:leucyl-tRNA synthetase